LIVLCAYVGYKTTDDISLFANDVLGFNEAEAAGLATAALWLRPVFALIAGFLMDRFNGQMILKYCFGLAAISGLSIASGIGNALFPFAILLSMMLAGI
jgi:MFS family permease